MADFILPDKPYLNPVFPNSFPDPFVLKFRGEYFAYCTDFRNDGKVFGVLNSRDLVNWKEIGGAMTPLENSPPFYWAPEVIYSNGRFYLYYSVGNETLMEIRVAVSDQPDGGFIDSGKRLTFEDFAIDAHVFIDDDGQKYLFYATDFFDHTHIGTGTVVDRLIDFDTVEGKPRPVTRAKYDWQIYDPHRKEKGGVRWHTIEGSFVLKRKGIYYQMFSGGNWQNTTYGVSFATTDNISKDEEWEQFSDGEKVFPILRTIPGLVKGPGHNSVVRGPNNRELFCIYHQWTENGRALSIDRMDFTGGKRMFVFGATTSPQPAPYQPKFIDFFDELSDKNWKIISGLWHTRDNQLICAYSPASELLCHHKAESFLLEISLRAIEKTKGKFGICLKDDANKIFQLLFDLDKTGIVIFRQKNNHTESFLFQLPLSFDFYVFHLLRVEMDHFWLKVSLDEQIMVFQQTLEKIPMNVSLTAEHCPAAYSGFALTNGFENLFEENDLETRGWHIIKGDGDYQIKDKNLKITNQGAIETIIRKEFSATNYELTFNMQLVEIFNDDFKFGLSMVFNEKEPFLSILFKRKESGWAVQIETIKEIKQFALPENFSPDVFHQFSFLKIENELILKLETTIIGAAKITQPSPGVAFFLKNASIVFEMIRLTAL